MTPMSCCIGITHPWPGVSRDPLALPLPLLVPPKAWADSLAFFAPPYQVDEGGAVDVLVTRTGTDLDRGPRRRGNSMRRAKRWRAGRGGAWNSLI